MNVAVLSTVFAGVFAGRRVLRGLVIGCVVLPVLLGAAPPAFGQEQPAAGADSAVSSDAARAAATADGAESTDVVAAAAAAADSAAATDAAAESATGPGSTAASAAVVPYPPALSFKAGIAFGYPSAVTVGFRFVDPAEINVMVGTDYLGVMIGMNGLWSIAALRTADDQFTISVGPELQLRFRPVIVAGATTTATVFSALARGRIENTLLVAPLNLFLEVAIGLAFAEPIELALASAIGVRFVF